MKGNYNVTISWFLIVGVLATVFIFFDDSFNSSNDSRYDISDNSILISDSSYNNSYEEVKTIDRDDAIYKYWDEIKEYVRGTETIDACSNESGNCYSLDAEISDGQVEMIYFPNGGYLYFSADIDESGNAFDFDQNGNGWDFTIDMNSSIIDDAIYDWARDNDYIIE